MTQTDLSFEELVKIRQSTRRFSDKAIPKELMNKCIEAARLAPSASNSQPWKFIVVDDKELKQKIAKCTYEGVGFFNKFTAQAAAMVVIAIEKQKLLTQLGKLIKKVNWEYIDIGIAAQHFCLQADALGIGSCMIGWYNEEGIKSLLSMPSDVKVGLVIAVGYPVEGYRIRNKSRKKIEEMLSYNKY